MSEIVDWKSVCGSLATVSGLLEREEQEDECT